METMMPFLGLYPPRKSNSNIGERLTIACLELEVLLNQLEPSVVIEQHLSSLKQALFHSHTRVVQVAVKQFLRLASDRLLAEQLSEDMEVVLGMIENLAHKEHTVAQECVTVLLLLSSTRKALLNLLCPDISEVLKTIMTYVAVRLLVYEFIMQLSINSPLGLEKSHSCGILEDIINDFKKKESYLSNVHYHQLYTLATTPHGRSYLVKYDALEAVPKQSPDVSAACLSYLITVVPTDITANASAPSTRRESTDSEDVKMQKENCKQKSVDSLKCPSANPVVMPTLFLDQLPHSPRDCSESRVQLTPSSSSLSSPCGSVDSSTTCRKDLVSDSSSQADRSFTPPLHSPTHPSDMCQELSALVLTKLVSSMQSVEPDELLTRHPDTLHTVLRALQAQDSDRHSALLALQVLGYIGSTIEGKRLLYKQSKKEKFMSMVMRKLLSAVIHSPTEQRARAMNIFYNLINVTESNIKYEKITRKWFRQMGRPQEIMKIIMMLCQQPPEVTQVLAFRLVLSLTRQEWGQHYIRARRGLVDLLLSSSHESQTIRQVKNSVLEAILESPTAGKIFRPQTLDCIHNYLLKYKECS